MTVSVTDNAILERIEALLAINWERKPQALELPAEIYVGTIGLASQLFGESSPQVQALVQAKADIRVSSWDTWAKEERLIAECKGVLRAIAGDVRAGLTRGIRLQAQAEVFADLILLARTALDAGAKDTAAVLAAAALEDSLKKLASSHGMTVDDHEMSDVINALKAKGVLPAAQGALLKGFVQIRNKALHAEWGKIDVAGVQALVAFTEQFILSRLT